jgi:hypothetical protein
MVTVSGKVVAIKRMDDAGGNHRGDAGGPTGGLAAGLVSPLRPREYILSEPSSSSSFGGPVLPREASLHLVTLAHLDLPELDPKATRRDRAARAARGNILRQVMVGVGVV